MTPGVVGGPFLADLSHDLRTPLNGVLGFAALLHEGRLGPLTADQKQCLGDIISSARDMDRMLGQISDLARVESGKREIRPEPLDIRELVGEACAGLREAADPRGVLVSGLVDPALDGVVADRSALRQIVAVCGALAVKVTPDGGRVAIRAAPDGARRFRIEIEDGGSRAQDLDVNAGLGLVLSRRLAEVQGGALSVGAGTGRGSVVTAVLPRTPEGAHGG